MKKKCRFLLCTTDNKCQGFARNNNYRICHSERSEESFIKSISISRFLTLFGMTNALSVIQSDTIHFVGSVNKNIKCILIFFILKFFALPFNSLKGKGFRSLNKKNKSVLWGFPFRGNRSSEGKNIFIQFIISDIYN